MTDDMLHLNTLEAPQQDTMRCVVRLTTSTWADARGLHRKQSLTYLKRQSHGHELVKEEVDNIGAKETWGMFLDLHNYPDGVYLVTPCNEVRDYETGYIDDYDFCLTAFTHDPAHEAQP